MPYFLEAKEGVAFIDIRVISNALNTAVCLALLMRPYWNCSSMRRR